MDPTKQPVPEGTDDAAPGRTTEGAPDERVTYGGGFQPGGGLVEPDEFDDATREPELPHDALAEGILDRRAASQPGGTVDPAAAPEGNDAGGRAGDVSGYLGSDRVVGIDPSRQGEKPPAERSTGD